MDSAKLIQIYDDILDNYINRTLGPLKEIFVTQRKKYAYILEKLFRFYFFTSYLTDQKISAGGSDRVLFSIYSKCSLDLLAIYHCLRNGLEVEACIIFRSLFESYINVELMLKENAKERIKLFAEFQHVQRWQHVLKHKKLIEKGIEDELDLPKAILEVYEQNYNKVKNNYNLKRPYHWAWKIFNKELKGQNPTLKTICEYLGPDYEKDYVQGYGTDSIISHGNAILHDYYTNNERNVTVNSPKFTDTINSLGVLTIDYCSKVILSILKYLEVQDYNDIKIYINNYREEVLFHEY